MTPEFMDCGSSPAMTMPCSWIAGQARNDNALPVEAQPAMRSSNHQRWLRHRFDLFFQHLHLALPVVAGTEPGEIDREDRVVPPAREPGAVVDQAQRAQR